PVLWSSDGSAAGTQRLDGGAPNRLFAHRGGLMFAALHPQAGFELWNADASGVQLLADLNPGAGGSFPHQFTPAGERLFFAADDERGFTRLWSLGKDGRIERVAGP
ncbi:MAG: hypothetical protein WAQ05_25065, partial [Rubrivivax sp.]